MSAERQPAAVDGDLPLQSREALEHHLDALVRPTAEDALDIATLEGLALRQAVYRARDAVAAFDDILMQLQDADFSMHEALSGLEAETLTDDHGWDAILHALADLPEDADELRAVGLVKFRRFLRNRLEALEARETEVAGARRNGPAAAPAQAEEPLPLDDIELDLELGGESATEAGEADEAAADDGFRATALLRDPLPAPRAEAAAPRSGGDEEVPKRLLRLRRGKPMTLSLAGRPEVDVWMGRSRFRILLADGPSLVADHGECGRLRNGRNLIGRSPDCEIVIDARYETVSRVHLEAAVDNGRLVSITDLSSGGTYVRPELVPGRTDAA